MILRSRSTITLPLFQDNVQPSDSKIDINSIGTPPRNSMKNINAQSTHNSGGSTTNLRLLKYIVGIAFLACVLLYITMMQSINDPDRHRTVRGKPQQRILTVVMNTFKRHDLMIGKYISYVFQSLSFSRSLTYSASLFRGNRLLFKL